MGSPLKNNYIRSRIRQLLLISQNRQGYFMTAVATGFTQQTKRFTMKLQPFTETRRNLPHGWFAVQVRGLVRIDSFHTKRLDFLRPLVVYSLLSHPCLHALCSAFSRSSVLSTEQARCTRKRSLYFAQLSETDASSCTKHKK
jgi:hypothetical protein